MDHEDTRERKEASAVRDENTTAADAGTGEASVPEFMEPEETGMVAEKTLETESAAAAPSEAPEVPEDSPAAVPGSDAENALSRRLAQLEQELADEKNHKLRILADFDNLRKRASRDMQNAAAKATADVVVEFLPVFDHLEMAISHVQEHGGGDGLVEGVNMVLKQFRATLSKFGIQEIDALGQHFDPALHEAVAQASSTEFPAGIVSKQWQKGFVLGERLIRPCRVVVSTGPGPAAQEPRPPEAEAGAAKERMDDFDGGETTRPDGEKPNG